VARLTLSIWDMPPRCMTLWRENVNPKEHGFSINALQANRAKCVD